MSNLINGIMVGTGRSLGKAGGSNLPIKILTKEEYETMDKQEGVIYIISDADDAAEGLVKLTREQYNNLDSISPDKLYVITDEELSEPEVDLSAYYTKEETDSITSNLATLSDLDEVRNLIGEINTMLESI